MSVTKAAVGRVLLIKLADPRSSPKDNQVSRIPQILAQSRIVVERLASLVPIHLIA